MSISEEERCTFSTVVWHKEMTTLAVAQTFFWKISITVVFLAHKIKLCTNKHNQPYMQLIDQGWSSSVRFILITLCVAYNDMLLQTWILHTQNLLPKPCNFCHVSFGQQQWWVEAPSTDIRAPVAWRRTEDVIWRVVLGGLQLWRSLDICSNTWWMTKSNKSWQSRFVDAFLV